MAIPSERKACLPAPECDTFPLFYCGTLFVGEYGSKFQSENKRKRHRSCTVNNTHHRTPPIQNSKENSNELFSVYVHKYTYTHLHTYISNTYRPPHTHTHFKKKDLDINCDIMNSCGPGHC